MTTSPSNPRIDRLAPGIRPARRPVMRQEWNHLLFLHWEVPVDRLRPLVPAGLELDLYEGKAYIGLVPFTMRGIRPAGGPTLPILSRFHETNVRTYVHAGGRDPGVWFFSLDAANPIAVAAARAWFFLPYHYARMSLRIDPPGPESAAETISYASNRLAPGPLPASLSARCAPKGPASTTEPGTLDHFLVERYVLYSARRGRLYRGQVHHAPYSVRAADVLSLQDSLTDASGIRHPDTPPLAHYSRGVEVEVFPLERA